MQPENVPPYHNGYFVSNVPKPLPGLVQLAASLTSGMGCVIGALLGLTGLIMPGKIKQVTENHRLLGYVVS